MIRRLLNPDNALAYIVRGLTKNSPDDEEGANTDFEQAILIAPDLADDPRERIFLRAFYKALQRPQPLE